MDEVQMHKPRIIMMRHSERLDFALKNNYWPQEVFINGIYSPNATQMPTVLPTRPNPNEYSLDTPLSRFGRSYAYHTGKFFRSLHLIPNQVYTSPAMRCVQTADAVLKGLGVDDLVPLKIELALYEPSKQSVPLQPAKFYSRAGFFVDLSYRPVLLPAQSRWIIDESRAAYYRRMHACLKRITATLINKNSKSLTPPTALIVTHRPCVPSLAAMLNIDIVPHKLAYLAKMERNKQDDVDFLSMVIAEYDAASGVWKYLQNYPEMPTKLTLTAWRTNNTRSNF